MFKNKVISNIVDSVVNEPDKFGDIICEIVEENLPSALKKMKDGELTFFNYQSIHENIINKYSKYHCDFDNLKNLLDKKVNRQEIDNYSIHSINLSFGKTDKIEAFYNDIIKSSKDFVKKYKNIKKIDKQCKKETKSYLKNLNEDIQIKINEICKNEKECLKKSYNMLYKLSKSKTGIPSSEFAKFFKNKLRNLIKSLLNVYVYNASDLEEISNELDEEAKVILQRKTGRLSARMGDFMKNLDNKLKKQPETSKISSNISSSNEEIGQLKRSIKFTSANLDKYKKMKKVGIPMPNIISDVMMNIKSVDEQKAIINELDNDETQDKREEIIEEIKLKFNKMEDIMKVLEDHEIDDEKIKSIIFQLFGYDI